MNLVDILIKALGGHTARAFEAQVASRKQAKAQRDDSIREIRELRGRLQAAPRAERMLGEIMADLPAPPFR